MFLFRIIKLTDWWSSFLEVALLAEEVDWKEARTMVRLGGMKRI